MPVTSLYAAILAIFFIGLTLNVVRLRVKYQVGIKDGGHNPLELAIRVHGNFAEFIPIALFLMALLESQRANINWLHIMGQALVVGRILHFWGLGIKGQGASIPRFSGSLITFSAIVWAAAWLLMITITGRN